MLFETLELGPVVLIVSSILCSAQWSRLRKVCEPDLGLFFVGEFARAWFWRRETSGLVELLLVMLEVSEMVLES